MNTADLINEAVSLPSEERARVVDALLRTLNPVDAANDGAWVALARQRLADIDAGRAETVAGEDVFERIGRRLEE